MREGTSMAGIGKNSKSMDIQRPGTTEPDSSSRPIISSGRRAMQDPMVKEDEKKSEATGSAKAEEKPIKTPEPKRAAKRVIAPISSPAKTEDKSPSAADTEDKPANTAEDDEKAKETAVVDAVVQAAGSNKSQNESVEVVDEKRRQEAQVLIDSKKYQVPIGQVTRAKNNKRLAVFLVFLVIVAMAYIAIDAGLVAAPIELPIKIFNNTN
jgi:hypothetical protein